MSDTASISILLLLAALSSYIGGSAALTNKVLILSFDGFRWDYLDIVEGLKHFPKFVEAGSSAPYMNNTFTTMTFPTHYSMSTGLYQESHGIVSNYMYDPVFEEFFYPGCPTANDQKWWHGEPIWITATKQERRAGVIYWAGSEVSFNGIMPEFWLKYDKSTPFEQRVDTILDWFVDEDIDLGMVYFHEPDGTGHKYGPYSSEVAEKVQMVDEVLGYVIEQVATRGLENELNILVVSDHGLANQSLDRLVVVPDYVDWSFVDVFSENGAICHVLPKEDKLDDVYNSLKGAHPHMSVYKRDEIPERWHYSDNRRIGPVLLVMDEGWSCTTNRSNSWNTDKGIHGYDNQQLSMKPIFMAKGPDIKVNFTIRPFMSLDIHPLTAELLEIRPAPNNGSLKIVGDIILSQPRTLTVTTDGAVTAATGTTLSITLVCSLVLIFNLWNLIE